MEGGIMVMVGETVNIHCFACSGFHQLPGADQGDMGRLQDFHGPIQVVKAENQHGMILIALCQAVHVFNVQAVLIERLKQFSELPGSVGDLDCNHLCQADGKTAVSQYPFGFLRIAYDQSQYTELRCVCQRYRLDINIDFPRFVAIFASLPALFSIKTESCSIFIGNFLPIAAVSAINQFRLCRKLIPVTAYCPDRFFHQFPA